MNLATQDCIIPLNDNIGTINIMVAVEVHKGVYGLQWVSFQQSDPGSEVVRKLSETYKRHRSLFNLRTWTFKPVVYIARVRRIGLSEHLLEANDQTAPVKLRDSRKDEYLTSQIRHPENFPSAWRLQQYLTNTIGYSAVHNYPPYTTTTRTIKAIMIRSEVSKIAVLVVVSVFLAMSVMAGVIISVCTGKTEAGIAVTSAIVTIMAVIQGFSK